MTFLEIADINLPPQSGCRRGMEIHHWQDDKEIKQLMLKRIAQ